MAEGAQLAEWDRASHLLAMLANCHRDPKRGAPYQPRQFNPFAPPQQIPKAPITALKALIGFQPKSNQ